MQGLPASIDVERFAEVRVFHSLSGYGYRPVPGACVRDRCDAKGNQGREAGPQALQPFSLLIMFLVEARRVVRGKHYLVAFGVEQLVTTFDAFLCTCETRRMQR